jgi:GntR family transcriptional regulator, transcriptional repressor for pyruvate dehydrogenase complex
MTENITISHEIAAVLRDEILRQQFRCGERFPSERDLAVRFNASRGAVREALSQLELLGLIRILPGGTRVQAIDSASIAVLGPLMAMDDMPDPVLVDQFLQTFGALTSLTARTAINRADAKQLILLQEMVVELAQQLSDFEAMQPKWREFLQTMETVADNLVVRLIGNDLKAQFVEQMMKLGVKPEVEKKTLEQLLSSLQQSLANGDGERAASAIQTHFDEVRLAVTEAMNSELMPPELTNAKPGNSKLANDRAEDLQRETV